MKYKKTTFLLLVAFVILPGILFAQSITYTYDDAGNRTSRIYAVNLRSATNYTNPPDSVEVEAPLGQLSVRVYPNPTKGDLVIDVTGLKDNEMIQLVLFDPQGRQLQRLQVKSGLARINMSSYPSGWYMLRAIRKDEKIEFKIIKE